MCELQRFRIWTCRPGFLCLALFGASQVALVVTNLPASAGDMRCESHPWVGSIPWRRKWQSTSVFLPGYAYGQRTWRDTVFGVQSWTWLSDLASSQVGASDCVTERPLYTSSSWLSSTNSAPSAQKSQNSSRSPRDDCFISLNCFHSLKWSLWWMGQIWVLIQPWGWLLLTT